jgi:hypothetical protein
MTGFSATVSGIVVDSSVTGSVVASVVWDVVIGSGAVVAVVVSDVCGIVSSGFSFGSQAVKVRASAAVSKKSIVFFIVKSSLNG